MTPTMTHWIDRVYFSVPHDCDVARISGFDDRSCEHWVIVGAGKGYRERRDEALIKIQESIESGDPPGEVK